MGRGSIPARGPVRRRLHGFVSLANNNAPLIMVLVVHLLKVRRLAALECLQGVPGADLQCNQSVIPGKCALNSVLDAVVLCIRTPDCEAVVHYPNGAVGFLLSTLLELVGETAWRGGKEYSCSCRGRPQQQPT